MGSLRNFAAMLEATGDHEGAQLRLEEVVALSRRFYGDSDPATLAAIADLGSNRFTLGDRAAALPLLTEAVAIGVQHSSTLHAIMKLSAMRADTAVWALIAWPGCCRRRWWKRGSARGQGSWTHLMLSAPMVFSSFS